MTAAQIHRGPDGTRIFSADSETALGHTRLAILDLSPAGAQPMTSRDGRWTMVCNGEIFNYRELRAGLGKGPGWWRSCSDTEVLLEACAAWGVEKALESAVGMFAFALWDGRERELTLARDRLGEKPLIYFERDGSLFFASELKALRELHGGCVDAAGLDAYLALGYIPAPLTIFRNIKKLPAGHLMRRKNGRCRVERWWHPEGSRPDLSRTAAGRREQLRSFIADAVRLRLRADVPVALALSGGVDSTVIGAEAARQGRMAEAFTVIADGDESDLPYAKSAANRYGLRHEVVRLAAASVRQRLIQAAEHFDEPFADSSAFTSLELARSVAGRYKVILTGDGGDEAFGGYRHYSRIAIKQAVKAIAAGLGLVDGTSATSIYVESKVTFRAWERRAFLGAQGRPLTGLLSADGFLSAFPAHGALKRALWTDRHLSLANGLMHKMDTALGAYGIEGRSPLLDHRIAEWTQWLPEHDLVRGSKKKILLREAYREDLPAEIHARGKHGFGAPVKAWLAGPLREMVDDLLPCPLLEREPQRQARGQRLWTLLTLAQWARSWEATF